MCFSDYGYYFATFWLDGRLYLVGTKIDILTTDFDSKSEILKRVGELLWASILAGCVIAIDTVTGQTETVASGVGIYYHLVYVPDMRAVFTLMKSGLSFSILYMTLNWGLVFSLQSLTLAKMNKAVFPLYSVGFIAYQK